MRPAPSQCATYKLRTAHATLRLNELCYTRSISSEMKLLVITLLAVLLVAHLQTSQGVHDLSAAYRFSATLDPNGQYELYWNYNLTAGTISFAVRVQTTGWVGFGLSPNGQMPGSDVVIGWVDSNGGVHFHVRESETFNIAGVDILITVCVYFQRTAMLRDATCPPLMQARTGSWSEGRRRVDTPSWSSPETSPPVMIKILMSR